MPPDSECQQCRPPEAKICLIHDSRTYLLNRMFDDLSWEAPGSIAQVTNEIVLLAL
jgi:hypothetical protein